MEKIHYVSLLSLDLAVIHERMNGILFVVLYSKKGEEWVMLDEYQMGFLDQCHEEYVAKWGEVVDIIKNNHNFCIHFISNKGARMIHSVTVIAEFFIKCSFPCQH